MGAHAVLIDSNTLEVYAVPDGIVELGRRESMAVCIPEPSVSGVHARIYNVDEGFWVEDLGSTNGTHIRGAMLVEPTMLAEGEVVYFGNIACTYEIRKDFQLEVTSRLADLESVVESIPEEEVPQEAVTQKQVPEHTIPSDSAVQVYRRKTSRVNFEQFKKVIEEGEDYSDSKPLPSKYEVTDSGRITPARTKRKQQIDYAFKTPQPTPVPWKTFLLVATLGSLGVGVVVGYLLARQLG